MYRERYTVHYTLYANNLDFFDLFSLKLFLGLAWFSFMFFSSIVVYREEYTPYADPILGIIFISTLIYSSSSLFRNPIIVFIHFSSLLWTDCPCYIGIYIEITHTKKCAERSLFQNTFNYKKYKKVTHLWIIFCELYIKKKY